MRYFWFFFVLVSLCLFVACSSMPNTQIAASPSPSATRPIPSATLTLTPTITVTPSPTPWPIESAKNVISSADEQWIAYFFDAGADQIAIKHAEKLTVYHIAVGDFMPFGFLFSPYRWSRDDRYLYFRILGNVDGYTTFFDGNGLLRLDVATGEVLKLLPADDDIYVIDFSLSPDDCQLAYVDTGDGDAQLVIRDLVTGEERSVLLKGYSNAGSILWSPKQDELVFTLTKGDDWSNTLFSAARISFPALTLKFLIKDRKGGFDTVKWVSDHEVLLKERGETISFLKLNLLSGELKLAPTMTPLPK